MRPDSSDQDVRDWLGGPYVRDLRGAYCSQCDHFYFRGPDDIGSLCDECCDARDYNADLQKLDRAANAIVSAVADFEQAITATHTAREALAIRRRLKQLYTAIDTAEGHALKRADELCAQEK